MKKLLTLCGFALLSLSASAQLFEPHVGVGVGVGTTGIAIDAGITLNDYLGLRGGVDIMPKFKVNKDIDLKTEDANKRLSQLTSEINELNQKLEAAGMQKVDLSQYPGGNLPERLDVQGKLDNNSGAFYNLTDFIKQKQSAWRFVPSISPTQGRYASSFGPRIHPVTGEVGKMHYGVDIANDRWTPIYASADGVVDVAQMSSTFGNFVTINHGNGIVTRYGHMQMSLVNPGQFVRRYQIIGYMGNTGRSVGPHLHYEVWVNNNPVNPLAYMLPGDYAVD